MKQWAACLAVCCAVGVSAQSVRVTSNGAARAAFAEAETVKNTDFEKAAALYRKSLDADIDFLPAHEGYILALKRFRMGPEAPVAPPTGPVATNGKGVPIYFAPKTRAIPFGGGPASDQLKAVYEAWRQAYPGKAVIAWGLGFVTLNLDRAGAEAAFKQALALDPNFSPAYRSLALLALLNKDPDGRTAFLKKAVDADPLDDDAVLEYVETLSEGDRPARLWLVADRSPGTTAAYSALLKLSALAPSPDAKLPIYTRFWRTFPDLASYSHCWTMKTYFNLTSGSEPATALAVARRFDDVCVGDPDWPDLLGYQVKFTQARDLVGAKQFAPALALLKAITPPRSADGVPFYLLRAEAEGAGSARAAYESLLGMAAKEPKDPINQALTKFGLQLGKTAAAIGDDVWAAVGTIAKPFKDFTLRRYDTDAPVTLSSLRGRVVLVNFWFPTCGPCMNEFPYIQQALNKYRDQGFEILAINIVSSEDDAVLPLVKDKKLSFTTLRMPDKDFARREYGIAGAPSNFLIDRDGRLIYRPSIHDRETARTFELEIERLLARGAAK